MDKLLGTVCDDYNSRHIKELYFGAFFKSVTIKYISVKDDIVAEN